MTALKVSLLLHEVNKNINAVMYRRADTKNNFNQNNLNAII